MRIDAWAWHLACNSGEIQKWRRNKKFPCNDSIKVVLILDILIGRTLYDHLDGPNTLRSSWWAEYFTIILMGQTLYDHFDWPNTLRSSWWAEHFTIILMGRILYDHFDWPNTLRSSWWAKYFTIILMGRILYDHFDRPNTLRSFWLAEYNERITSMYRTHSDPKCAPSGLSLKIYCSI